MLYSASVKDKQTGRIVFIRNQDYPNKTLFIQDLRANGYSVNPNKVKPADVFEYILQYTNASPHDWATINAVPKGR